MALRLIRKTSDTPNITNKDDTKMTRYAYGGFNGVVKGFGNELQATFDAFSSVLKISSGKIVIDGWEIDVEGETTLEFNNLSGIKYYSVILSLNTSIESVSLDYIQGLSSFPPFLAGDDLTKYPNGTANILLYNVTVLNGKIDGVIPKFRIIPYLLDFENEFKSSNVLKFGNMVFSRREILWEGEKRTTNSSSFTIPNVQLSVGESLEVIWQAPSGSGYDVGGKHKTILEKAQNGNLRQLAPMSVDYDTNVITYAILKVSHTNYSELTFAGFKHFSQGGAATNSTATILSVRKVIE